jgi:ligand-binding sensor domain-containing protein
VAHSSGITLYDTSTGQIEKEFSKTAIFWTIDIFDSLLTGGGVETCALFKNQHEQYVSLGRDYNIPWSIVRDENGNLILGTQKGLYRIRCGKKKAECIGFKGKCIKSLLVDRKGRLWVGRYFKQ